MNSRREPAADWSTKLTRALALKDGTKLVTLADTRAVLLKYLATEVEDAALGTVGHALRLLLAAAKTGSLADRKAATDQVAIVLAHGKVY